MKKQKKYNVFRSAVRWLLGGQGGHKTPQDGHKTPQDSHKACQDGPEMRPRRPRGSKMPQGAAKMDQDSAKVARDGFKMAQDGSKCPKMAQDGPGMASIWPPVHRWIWMCVVLPPAARRQMLRDVDRFAARRPSADASRCGSLCRPPPARRCIEIRQDVPQRFPIKRAGVVSNLVPSCSREL